MTPPTITTLARAGSSIAMGAYTFIRALSDRSRGAEHRRAAAFALMSRSKAAGSGELWIDAGERQTFPTLCP